MKPEIGYEAIVNYQLGEEMDELIIPYIYDLIGDIEFNMKKTSLRDDYFQQLSIEKAALEALVCEILANSFYSPLVIIERFANKAAKSAKESTNPHNDYVFSVSRDAAMSILDSFYFGYMEGEERGGFEP